MEVIKTMPAGTPGTLRYVKAWNDQLIAVRYRKDTENQQVITTIEIVVDQRPLTPSLKSPRRTLPETALVGVQIDYSEIELREKMKELGAKWNARQRVWVLAYGMAKALGLGERIVQNCQI